MIRLSFNFLFAVILALPLSACRRSPTIDGQEFSSSAQIVQGLEVSETDPVALSTVGLWLSGQSTDESLHPSLCTATLIDENHALTAAHCVSYFEKGYVVFARNFKDRDSAHLREIIAVKSHPLYWLDQPESASGGSTLELDYHDLAVLRFRGSIPAPYRPAKLLRDASLLRAGSAVWIAGFGLTSAAGSTSGNWDKGVLRKGQLQLLDVSPQNSDLLFPLPQDGTSICHGDSGGPVYLQQNSELILIGVISRGRDEKCDKDSIATGVLPHLPFIEKTLRSKSP